MIEGGGVLDLDITSSNNLTITGCLNATGGVVKVNVPFNETSKALGPQTIDLFAASLCDSNTFIPVNVFIEGGACVRAESSVIRSTNPGVLQIAFDLVDPCSRASSLSRGPLSLGIFAMISCFLLF